MSYHNGHDYLSFHISRQGREGGDSVVKRGQQHNYGERNAELPANVPGNGIMNQGERNADFHSNNAYEIVEIDTKKDIDDILSRCMSTKCKPLTTIFAVLIFLLFVGFGGISYFMHQQSTTIDKAIAEISQFRLSVEQQNRRANESFHQLQVKHNTELLLLSGNQNNSFVALDKTIQDLGFSMESQLGATNNRMNMNDKEIQSDVDRIENNQRSIQSDLIDLGNKLEQLEKAVSVRLVNGNNTNEGRVEILHDGIWGTICDDRWDIRDAKVVCKMLGYSEAVGAYSGSFFGAGSGKIWLGYMECGGVEDHISECARYGWGSYSSLCQHHTRDAGVTCA